MTLSEHAVTVRDLFGTWILFLIFAGIELFPVEFVYSKQGLSICLFRDELKLYEPFAVIPVGSVRCYTIRCVHQLVVMLNVVALRQMCFCLFCLTHL
jgi:hypothetical protein